MKSSEIEALIKTVVRRVYYQYPDVEWDDLEAQAWLTVTEQIDKWDSTRGCSLSTYLYHKLYGNLRDYIQRYILKELNMNGTRDHIDYAEEIYGKEEGGRIEAKMTIEKIFDESEGVSRDILSLMAKGYSQSEVSEELKVSRQYVSQVLEKIRKRYT